MANRGKRGVVVDIRQPEGRNVLLDLLRTADVFITNTRPAALERACLDYESLHKLFPGLIYASVTTFGSKGPYGNSPGFDILSMSMAGALVNRDAEGYPLSPGIYIGDYSMPMLLGFGIMLALWTREKTGVGQKVESSTLAAAIAIQSGLIRIDSHPESTTPPALGLGGIFRCADGKFIAISVLTTEFSRRLCRLVDLPQVADDPRLGDPAFAEEVHAEIMPVIRERFAGRPSSEWLDLLREADIPSAPVLSRREVYDYPQVVANELFTQVDHPAVGGHTMFSPPVKLSETPGEIHAPSPTLGQHTDEVLRELGYDAERIAGLRAKQVIA
jgi:crotonobetainyl-CoA:carnitine CoA-transferase CaiB-like acyl-CoA transferase